MTEAIRSYLLSVVAVSMLCAVLLAVLPNHPVRRVCVLVCGLLLMLVCVAPIKEVSLTDLAQLIARNTMQEEFDTTGVSMQSRELVATLIKQKVEAYILDKAAAMGVDIQAEVTVEQGESYPYPSAVRITGDLTAEQKAALSDDLEANFAIDAAAQEWIHEEDTTNGTD
jgi:stage III sporulation protein AF